MPIKIQDILKEAVPRGKVSVSELATAEEAIIPSAEEMEKLSKRYTAHESDKRFNTHIADWQASPENLYKFVKNKFKKLRYYFAAIVLGWDELEEAMKKSLKEDGYSGQEIQELANWILETENGKYFQQLSSLADTYPLTEPVDPNANKVDEAIERHTTLNPKLFKDNKLKAPVQKKLLEIVEAFEDELALDGVKLFVKDVIMIGSNVSYNYTKDSDVDLHIVADDASLDCPEEIYNALYSAYRSLFNHKFDIDFYGIPVEVFVEIGDVKTISNGIYSVLENEWIKEPVLEDIPEIDQEAFKKEFDAWEKKYKKLKDDVKADKFEDEKPVVKFIEEIYDQRKTGLSKFGEYSTGNLVFKELRNKGYLDDLKDMRDALVSKRLSLEEALEQSKRSEIKAALQKVANSLSGELTLLDDSFKIAGVPDSRARDVVYELSQIPHLHNVRISSITNKFDTNPASQSFGRKNKNEYSIVGLID